MNYYLFIIVLIAIIYISFKFLKINNAESRFLKIAFIILILFSAFRADTVGTDLGRYKIFYNLFENFSLQRILETRDTEIGYVLYSLVIHKLTAGNYQIFLAITSFISLIGVYKFIKDNSKDYFLGVILYFCLTYYTFTFSGLRQAIAISILLTSIKYIKNEKKIKFLIYVLLAASFHSSALIFLPAYFINKIELKPKHIILYFGILACIYFFRYNIVNIFISDIYSDYAILTNQGNGYKILLLYVLLIIIFSLYRKKCVLSDKANNLFFNFLLVGTAIQVLATVEGNAHRATFYYLVPTIALIPNILNVFQKKYQTIMKVMLIVILIIFYLVVSTEIPYQLFWV